MYKAFTKLFTSAYSFFYTSIQIFLQVHTYFLLCKKYAELCMYFYLEGQSTCKKIQSKERKQLVLIKVVHITRWGMHQLYLYLLTKPNFISFRNKADTSLLLMSTSTYRSSYKLFYL